jgi:quercetin dioxygenase-like cupin family protein
MKELHSNKRNFVILGLAGLVLLSLLLLTGIATATPPSNVTGVTVANGALPEVIRAKFMERKSGFTNGTDVKNIVLVRFTVEPGGTFGWHRHGGPVWAIVTSGTLTIYNGDDATCTPHIYGAGSAFLDSGDHTHLGKNETSDQVEIYATFMLPEGGQTRIDAPDPGVCGD